MGLDGVELIMAVESTFGISIPDADTEEMLTPALLIQYVQSAVQAKPEAKPCLSQRAFHSVRKDLMNVLSAKRNEIALDTKICKLFPKALRADKWEQFRQVSNIASLPDLRFGRGTVFAPTRVKCLVKQEVHRIAAAL